MMRNLVPSFVRVPASNVSLCLPLILGGSVQCWMGLRSTAMSDYTTIVGLNDGVEGGGNWIKPNMAKLCIALGLFCGTMLFASIPVLLSRRSHSRRFMVRHVLTGLSCLGGGVFLATCFLHLIPEATEKMDNALVDAKIDINLPLPYAIIIAGFLLVLILEQVNIRRVVP